MRASRPASLEALSTDEPDSLAGLALEYSARSVRFINTRSGSSPAIQPRDPAAEAVLWFHSRIYFLTTRALVGRALATGSPGLGKDASRCAAQTLVAVERSRAALQQLPGHEVERGALIALLDGIARGIEERFPGARTLPSGSTGRSRGRDGNR